MRTRRAAVVFIVLAWAAVIVTQCAKTGSKTVPEVPGKPQPSHIYGVAIENDAYVPDVVAAAVGDSVLWNNHDNTDHTVTSDTGNELNGSLGPTETYVHVFKTAGEFPYHCRNHPDMHGSVTVR
jgi:plastocyanin